MANGTSSTLSVQTQQLIAQVISIGGMLAVGMGYLTSEQVAGLSTSILAIIGPIMTVVGIVYSLFASRKAAVVTAVASLPEVRAVVTENTVEGRDLAHSDNTPSNVVVGPPPGTPVPVPPAHP
jgi:hypothetical protein